MSEIPFGWLGESRRSALRALIANEVTEWSSDWWMHHDVDDVEVSSIGQEDMVTSHALPYTSVSPSGSLAMRFGGKDMDAIGRHLAGAVDGADAGWAQRIGEEALEALTVRLFRRAGVAHAPRLSESIESPDLECDYFGAMHSRIVLGRLSWGLTIDRRLADRLAPARVTQGTALTSRATAINRAGVRIRAILDFGLVNLTDLSDLSVGEILVSERGLQDSLQLHLEGHGLVAGGYLKRRGTRRAVMLDGHSIHGDKL